MTKIDDQAGEPAELATGWSVTRLASCVGWVLG